MGTRLEWYNEWKSSVSSDNKIEEIIEARKSFIFGNLFAKIFFFLQNDNMLYLR